MVAGKFNKRAILLALGLLLVLLVFGPAVPAHAQTYRFSLPVYEVEAYIEEDGSVTLYYYMVFQNDPSASPIDYVDLALPYANYNLRDIVATIDGQPMPEVNDSAYVNTTRSARDCYCHRSWHYRYSFSLRPGRSRRFRQLPVHAKLFWFRI